MHELPRDQTDQLDLSEAPTEEISMAQLSLAEALHNPNATPADVADMHYMDRLFDDLRLAHQATNSDIEDRYPSIDASNYLRQQDASADAPRFRVISDALGEMQEGNSLAGDKSLRFRIEKGVDVKGEMETGGWAVSVDLYHHKGGFVSQVEADQNKTGQRERISELSTGVSLMPVSKELLGWMRNQIGDPTKLVEAPPTPAKPKSALGKMAMRLMGRQR